MEGHLRTIGNLNLYEVHYAVQPPRGGDSRDLETAAVISYTCQA